MSKQFILIGGLPGSGKTHIGKILANDINAVYLDKDTISRDFTEAMLVEIGCSSDDRESELYLAKVRDHEYSTMMKIGMENLELGNSVICSAPFISEFKSNEWVDERVFDAEMADAEFSAIWIHVDETTANDRIVSRGASRDNWKLTNWAVYTEKTPHITPIFDFEYILIDNSLDPATPLDQQICDVIGRLNGG